MNDNSLKLLLGYTHTPAQDKKTDTDNDNRDV